MRDIPLPFCTSNAVGSNVPEAHLGKGLYMPSLKAFMDDTTLVMNRRPVVQNTLDTFNSLLGWCRMAFKPAKSRSLALVKGKICSDVSFVVAGQRVPTVSKEPVKSLGRVFNDSLTDKTRKATRLGKLLRGCRLSERHHYKEGSRYGCSSLCFFQGCCGH